MFKIADTGSVCCAAVALWITTGCDTYRRTWQDVDILVADPVSGAGLSGANVEVAPYFYPGWLADTPKAERERAWLDRFGNEAKTTDRAGHTTLALEIGTICGALQTFDPHRDRVTDTDYLFRIRRDEISETLRVTMAPDSITHGKLFAVVVLSIDKPRGKK